MIESDFGVAGVVSPQPLADGPGEHLRLLGDLFGRLAGLCLPTGKILHSLTRERRSDILLPVVHSYP